MKTSILIGLTAGFFGLVTAANATAILTLSPTSGALSGQAGSTVGWGFTLSNSSDYAVVSSSNFCLGSSGATSLCVASTIGIYTDEIASSFIVVGPTPESPVVTQAFSASLATGVGSFSITPGEPVGATNVGQLVLTYDLYSVDPNSGTFDPIADLVSAGNFLMAPASVSVASIPVTTMPEPASGWLVAMVGGGFLLLFRKRMK
jgi:hypothetical protein